jgi:hypothetical protein
MVGLGLESEVFKKMLTQEAPARTMSIAEFITLPKDGNRYLLSELAENSQMEADSYNSQLCRKFFQFRCC